MIGAFIENIKNPKNVVPTLICAYVAVLGGYWWTVYFGRWEFVGQFLGFLGVLAILWTLLRVAVTRIVFGIIVVVLVGGYFYWYSKSRSVEEKTLSFEREHEPWIREVHTRKRPKYVDNGIAQKFNEAAFAPAFMFESTFLRSKWRTKITEQRSDWAPSKK